MDLHREAAKKGRRGEEFSYFYCVRFTQLLKGFGDLGKVVLDRLVCVYGGG